MKVSWWHRTAQSWILGTAWILLILCASKNFFIEPACLGTEVVLTFSAYLFVAFTYVHATPVCYTLPLLTTAFTDYWVLPAQPHWPYARNHLRRVRHDMTPKEKAQDLSTIMSSMSNQLMRVCCLASQAGMTGLPLRNYRAEQAAVPSYYIRNRGFETHQERVEVTARRTIHSTPFLSSGEGETNSSNSRTLYLT